MYGEIKCDPTKSAEEAEIDKMADDVRCKMIACSKNVATHPTVTQSSVEQASTAAGRFGWITVLNDVPLPFIKRDNNEYVAEEMIAQAIIPTIKSNIVSNEVIKCWKLAQDSIDKTEAALLNEINQEHCDGLFGEYKYTKGDIVFKLCDLKEFLKFVIICGEMITGANRKNEYCGFIRINNENAIPFVWDDSKQMLPLFYFEEQSNYLQMKAKELTDIRKLSYLKFCCKLQKIKPSYYEQNSIPVIDLEELKKLFKESTKFELHYPEDFNDEVLPSNLKQNAINSVQTGISERAVHLSSSSYQNGSFIVVPTGTYVPPVPSSLLHATNFSISNVTKQSLYNAISLAVTSPQAHTVDSFLSQPHTMQTTAFPRSSPAVEPRTLPSYSSIKYPQSTASERINPYSRTKYAQKTQSRANFQVQVQKNRNRFHSQQAPHFQTFTYQPPPPLQSVQMNSQTQVLPGSFSPDPSIHNNYVPYSSNVQTTNAVVSNPYNSSIDSFGHDYVVQKCIVHNRALSYFEHNSDPNCYIPIEEIQNFFKEFPRESRNSAINKLCFIGLGSGLRSLWRNTTRRIITGFAVGFRNRRDLEILLEHLNKDIVS